MKQERHFWKSLPGFVLVLILLVFLGGGRCVLRSFAHDNVFNLQSDAYLPVIYNLTGTPTGSPTPCSKPVIEFDSVPPYGSYDDLSGHVECVTPSDYKVAVFINVSGWWTKPYLSSPLTTIQNDGTWLTDITTGGSDQLATDIAAFLIPNSYNPPLLSGEATFPQELYTNAASFVSVPRRATRTISFSGYTWDVKFTPTLAGPGPNYFSDDPADVWVDNDGYLHLNIIYRDGIWYSTEVICSELLAYGSYTITLGSRVDLLDKNVVLGFFTWDTDAPQYHYREIDIEFSRWGEDIAPNTQYVIQPWDVSGNRHRFDMNLADTDSMHQIDWHNDQIQFFSWGQDYSSLQSWTYTNPAYIPPAGAGHARINLWLLNGWAPSDDQNVEAIIKTFDFNPASP